MFAIIQDTRREPDGWPHGWWELTTNPSPCPGLVV
jgi:hypothetical protein